MEATLLWTLRQLYHSLERQGRQSMRELELSLGQAIVLCWLLSQKGECVCAADLHKALGLSKSALSSTLKELQAKQYLLTVETPEDDRKKRLVLTSRAFARQCQLCAVRGGWGCFRPASHLRLNAGDAGFFSNAE